MNNAFENFDKQDSEARNVVANWNNLINNGVELVEEFQKTLKSIQFEIITLIDKWEPFEGEEVLKELIDDLVKINKVCQNALDGFPNKQDAEIIRTIVDSEFPS